MASKRDTLQILSIVYPCLMICWAVAMRGAEYFWPATLLLYMPQHIWLIMPALLLLTALARRNRQSAAWNLVTLGFIGFVLMGFRLPLGRIGVKPGMHIRVMTYNIHHGAAGLKSISATVKRENPDIVCLQEANTADWKSELPVEMDMLLPGWHIARFRELATLSRYPIVSHEVRRMQPRTGRAVLVTVLDVQGRRISVLNTHINPVAEGSLLRRKVSLRQYVKDSVTTRSGQIEIVRKTASESEGPIVIMGDFNNPPRGALYRRMTTDFHDAFGLRGFGWGHTYRTRLPVLRIDYVLVNDGLGVKRCVVPKVFASDHRPVVADIVIPRGDRQ